MKFKLTSARLDDLDLLVEHRLDMWQDILPESKTRPREFEKVTRDWIRQRLSDGSLFGFIARAPDGKVAGSGCIWLRDEQPRPMNPGHVSPYLMSMYTEKEFRRMGVGRLIVEQALKWCREHNYGRIVLHASDEGRPLYESVGFGPTREMKLDL